MIALTHRGVSSRAEWDLAGHCTPPHYMMKIPILLHKFCDFYDLLLV